MRILKILKDVKRALLIGIGGGGDIVSTLAVGDFFEIFDVECIYGGVIWERISRDKKPGPRSVEEIRNCRIINECLAWINRNSTVDGIRLIASQVSDFLNSEVVGIDITKGELSLTRSLKEFVEDEDIDLVVGVDAGGDSLARGRESGLHSPLADSIMIASLKKLKSMIAIVGFGSDGELTRHELEMYLSEIAERDGLLGANLISRDFAERLSGFIEEVETTASKIPIMASMGFFGRQRVWDKAVIEVSILNALIFYVDTSTVYELSPLPKAVEGSRSVFEANDMLHKIGIRTELDVEFDVFRRYFQTDPDVHRTIA